MEPFLLFSVLFLPGFISQGVQEIAPDMFESLFFNIFYIITAVPQLLLILYIISIKPERSLADFDIGKISKIDVPRSLLALIGIYLCIIPIGLITMLLEPEIDNQLVYGSGWSFSDYRLLPIVFISCMATGYLEEIFFRAYLFKSLQKTGAGLIPSAIAVNVLFGSGHIYEGYYAFAATAAIGFFLTWLFVKTKSIHTISIGHGLYNFSVLLIAMTGAL